METISYKFPLIAQELLEQEKYQEALDVCTDGLKLYPRTLSAYGMSATAIMHLYGSQAAQEFVQSISTDILAKPIYQIFVANIQQEIKIFELQFESDSLSMEEIAEEIAEELEAVDLVEIDEAEETIEEILPPITEEIGPLTEKQEQFTTDVDLEIATDEEELAHIEEIAGVEIDESFEEEIPDLDIADIDTPNDLTIPAENIGPTAQEIELLITEPPELEEEEQDIDELVQSEPVGAEIEQDVTIPAPMSETDFFIEDTRELFKTFEDIDYELELPIPDENADENEISEEIDVEEEVQDNDVDVLIPPSSILENDEFDDFDVREHATDKNDPTPEFLSDPALEDYYEQEQEAGYVMSATDTEIDTTPSMEEIKIGKHEDIFREDIFNMPEHRASRIVDIIPGFKDADIHKWDI